MLLEWAKNPAGEEAANELRERFPRHGNKGGAIFVMYRLMGERYSGYFTKSQVDDLFLILDYFKGRILCLSG